MVRVSVLSTKGTEYVEAAYATGASAARIIFKYILPNCLAPIIVQATMSVATTIMTATGLSFLGLGVPAPTPEWGAMASSSRAYIPVSYTHLDVYKRQDQRTAHLGANRFIGALQRQAKFAAMQANIFHRRLQPGDAVFCRYGRIHGHKAKCKLPGFFHFPRFKELNELRAFVGQHIGERERTSLCAKAEAWQQERCV